MWCLRVGTALPLLLQIPSAPAVYSWHAQSPGTSLADPSLWNGGLVGRGWQGQQGWHRGQEQQGLWGCC